MNKTINDYIAKIKEDEVKYKLLSSNEMLNNIDKIVNEFNTQAINKKDLSDVLLDVFGLLQALFVGVDSLYNMVLSITKNKYYININQNYIIHELKFIRNDVVGHPTNRKYGRYGVGYTKIKTDNLSNKTLTYNTVIFRNDVLIENNRTINFKTLITAYQNEKALIYKELEKYIKADYKNIDFSKNIINIFDNLTPHKLNNIKKLFIETYTDYEQHRFLWRLSLLETALTWESDNKKMKDLIAHIKVLQSHTLYQIARNMENKNYKIPKLKLPKILKQFYSALTKDQNLIAYIHNLNDPIHPFYQADLNHLIKEITNQNIKNFLNYLNNLKDNNKKYLIGSLLKQYRT